MSPSQIIVLAIPVFLVLIAIEIIIGLRRGRNTYRLNDAISSLSLGMLSRMSEVFVQLLRLGIYTAVYSSAALLSDTGFWTTLPGWLLAFLIYDFLFYWVHRLSHTVGVFWASHVVHHQSQDYNLSTALRQPGTSPLGWVFYLPMALIGVPPLVFATVALVNLLYQFWIHTEHVGRLGWFDRVFNAPSAHRVHHAVNERYLDKNHGGVFIVWDRLFGTYAEEDPKEPCVYGTRSPLNSWDPLWANAEVYVALAQDSWRARRWGDRLRVWLKPPGWRPPDVAAACPRAAFDITRVSLFAPPMKRRVQVFAVAQFALLLAGVAVFLWHADATPLWHNAIWFTVLLIGLWALGAVMQVRIGMLAALLLESAALSIASAATGWVELHHLFKPLTMVLALALLVQALRAPNTSLRGGTWLLAALATSLAGAVFLLLPGLFIPGLLVFLLAHLAYTMALCQDVPWLPSRRALGCVAAVATLMYGTFWVNGLPTGLHGPLAAYVLVISLLLAQAIGRAEVLRNLPARLVALGAACFTISGALLIADRFLTPLSPPAFWVLGSYYAAHCLLLIGLLRGGAPGLRATPSAAERLRH